MTGETLREDLKKVELSASWLARQIKVSRTMMEIWLKGKQNIPPARQRQIYSILSKVEEAVKAN